MAEKVYPPATKGQLFNRPMYQSHPPPPSSKRRRGCCCSLILALLSLILLAAIASGILYAIFRPHRPTFSISSLRLSALNISSSNHLTSRLDIAVTARNPNHKIAYIYDQISVSISSNGIGIGETSFPGFSNGAKNTTVMSSTSSTAADLKKSSVPLEIDMETKAGIKVGRLKTKKVGMKVHCDGIEIAAPKGKKPPPASTLDTSCKVKLRMKIWKWTI